jgi:hypothetical protein
MARPLWDSVPLYRLSEYRHGRDGCAESTPEPTMDALKISLVGRRVLRTEDVPLLRNEGR